MSRASKYTKCPMCGAEMIDGYLHDVFDVTYLISLKSLGTSIFGTLICPACGYVELQATSPEILDHESLFPRRLIPGTGQGEAT